MANDHSTDSKPHSRPRRASHRYLSCAYPRSLLNRATSATAVRLVQSLRKRIPEIRRRQRHLSLPYPRPHIIIESEFKHETHFETTLNLDFNPDLDLDPDVALDLESILDLNPDIGLDPDTDLDSPQPDTPPPSTPCLGLTASPLTRPPPLILYTTLIQELRSSPSPSTPTSYTLSIDRITPSLTDANDRLVVITRCNVSLTACPPDLLHAGFDRLTGCRWASWTAASKEERGCRFFGRVERLLLQGPLLEDDGEVGDVPQTLRDGKAPAALTTVAQARHCFEGSKDLAGHVWVVAVHHPPHFSPPLPSLSSRHKYPRPDTSSRPPEYLPWKLDSLHPVSGNALARAKDLWRKDFSPDYGRAERREMGCGFARWELHPAQPASPSSVVPMTPTTPFSPADPPSTIFIGDKKSPGPIVRIERLPLTAVGEMTSPHLPPAAIRFDKPFQPLCPERVFLPQSPVEQAVEEVFYAQDLTAEEEVLELEKRLRETYLEDDDDGGSQGVGVESPCKDKARRKGRSKKVVEGEEAGREACRPGDVGVEEAGGRVGRAPVGRRGRERGVRGVGGGLYHAMLK